MRTLWRWSATDLKGGGVTDNFLQFFLNFYIFSGERRGMYRARLEA